MNHKELPGFRKVRFYSIHGETAGLVLTETKFRQVTLNNLSRMFPDSECLKMGRVQYSPLFDTWNEAFLFDFNRDAVAANVTVNPQLCRGLA